jgi:SAM-dependent methyltransferase
LPGDVGLAALPRAICPLTLPAMTTGAEWQAAVGRNWANAWPLTDRSFAGLTQQLLDRIERLPGAAILDIGCGAGELSLAIARHRPRAEIFGIDISADLVAAATARAGERALVTFVEADAGQWVEPGFAPDLLVSRHGVMFFDRPEAAFAHLAAIATPAATLAFSCFRDRRLNPWISELAALLPPEVAAPFDPLAPGPFAFADPTRVEAILVASGWRDIAFEPLDFAYVAGLGDDPVADATAFFQQIGPAAAALRALKGSPAEASFVARLVSWLDENRSGDTVAFPAAAWFVSARRV